MRYSNIRAMGAFFGLQACTALMLAMLWVSPAFATATPFCPAIVQNAVVDMGKGLVQTPTDTERKASLRRLLDVSGCRQYHRNWLFGLARTGSLTDATTALYDYIIDEKKAESVSASVVPTRKLEDTEIERILRTMPSMIKVEMDKVRAEISNDYSALIDDFKRQIALHETTLALPDDYLARLRNIGTEVDDRIKQIVQSVNLLTASLKETNASIDALKASIGTPPAKSFGAGGGTPAIPHPSFRYEGISQYGDHSVRTTDQMVMGEYQWALANGTPFTIKAETRPSATGGGFGINAECNKPLVFRWKPINATNWVIELAIPARKCAS